MFGKRLKHLGRYRVITTAFARNGLGFVVKDLGLPEMLSISHWRLSQSEKASRKNKSIGARIRLILEELGPTFIKMGQIASTRPDLIPPDIIRELEKLQDRVPPFPFSEVRDLIEQELGQPPENIFARFDETPLAAASIGQVHDAVLHSGERVAVKVQRPGIRNTIETDLEILDDLARLAESRLDWAAEYQIRSMVAEFAKSLRAELDYRAEGRNAETMAAWFRDDPNVRFPAIYWDFSTSRVLTMEFIEGNKLGDRESWSVRGSDGKTLAKRLTDAIFRQILVAGLFHCDPHPGNVLVLPDNRIALIDFGMVGRLTPMTKYHFVSLLLALKRHSSKGVIRAVSRMGMIPENADMMKLWADVDQLREKYYDIPLSQMSLGEAVRDLFEVAHVHRIRIPADFTLLGKTLLTLEGVVEWLDPDFSIMHAAEPFGRALFRERLHPKTMAEITWERLVDGTDLAVQLPGKLRNVLTLMENGNAHINISVPELEIFMRKMDRISNRLSFSIVMLAFSIILVGLIIGYALGRGSIFLWKLPVIEIGLGVGALMFFWLLFAIFKSGRF